MTQFNMKQPSQIKDFLRCFAAGALVSATTLTPALAQTRSSAKDMLAACRALVEVTAIQVAASTAKVSALAGDAESVTALSRHAARLKTMVDAKSLASIKGVDVPLREIELSAATVVKHEIGLRTAHQGIRDFLSAASHVAYRVEDAQAREIATQAPNARVDGARQLNALIKQSLWNAESLSVPGSPSPEAIFLLGKGLNQFKSINNAMIDGSDTLRIPASVDADQRALWQKIGNDYTSLHQNAGAYLSNLVAIVEAGESSKAIQKAAAHGTQQLTPVCG